MTHPANDATVVVSRKRRAYRDSLRSCLVMLDGKKVAKVRQGGTVEVPVPVGGHEMYLKISWCQSPLIKFDAHAGEVIEFFAEPGGSASEGLNAVLNESGSYISLTRV